MIQSLFGKKIGMTQIFDKEGNVVPVTVVEAGPCTILGLQETPCRVKIGFEPVSESKLNKAQAGFFKKLGISAKRHVKEVASTDNKDYKVGQDLKVDAIFKPGDFVDVTGTSIGKGFAGGMKRWGWHGGGATHGSMHHRKIGAVSSGTDPSRVFKGHHMPGHMGHATVTVQGLRVMGIEPEANLVLIKGAIPGHRNSLVTINLSFKKVFKPLDEKKVIVEHKINPMKQSKAKATGKGAAK